MLKLAEHEHLYYLINSTSENETLDISFKSCLFKLCTFYSGRIAISTDSEMNTYEDVYQSTTAIMEHLVANGVSSHDRIAVALDRSPEFIYSILAVLCLGACYIPLDNTLPKELVDQQMLEADIDFIINAKPIPIQGPRKIKVAKVNSRLPKKDFSTETTQVNQRESHNRLAYIIFTSGSTGKPKATGISVAGLLSSTAARVGYYHTKTIHKNMLLSSLSFDSSVAVIFGSLFSGDNLYLAPVGVEKDIEAVSNLVKDAEITSLLNLPSYLSALIAYDNGVNSAGLKRIVMAGEKVRVDDLTNIRAITPEAQIYNEYGPAEATVWATVASLNLMNDFEDGVPIGQAVSHVTLHVLDDELKQVAIGEAGELCIGGVGVAVGYTNNIRETALRFVPDPYSDVPGRRLYRTGDRCMWRSDGNLSFIDRIDRQFKLDGYRIEPGFIERNAMMLEGVDNAVIVLVPSKESGSIHLFTSSSLTASCIRDHLYSQIPTYMMPALIHTLYNMPHLPNGKLDFRQVLKDATDFRTVSCSSIYSENDYLMTSIRNVWYRVLGVDSIGDEDNFFSLGGSSMKAAMIINRIKKILNVRISVAILFKEPTIQGMYNSLIQVPEVHKILRDIGNSKSS
ncbi:non-ribosomal peptide synthetase [Pseudomonas graminis]|uniref:non-ribosomal peptide synthetase n=1 Tax=Pseudomonas graminis TaxID=158627 RepID=UPI0023499B8C|nr:non-ribosomal peptide synthetase [Pseudomonas graminis]MDC6379897.1 non-ribosomal peptide synthetase [Pseudomonas graminis]